MNATAVEPLSALLPALSPQAARGARLLHDRRLAEVWDALDGGRGLALAPVREAGAPNVHRLELRGDAGTLALFVAARDDAALAMVAAAKLDPALRALVLSGVFGELLEGCAALALNGWRVAALEPVAAAAAPAAGWCALRRAGRELCRIAVQHIDPGVEDALCALRQPVEPAYGWRARVRLPAAAIVGMRTLPLATLRSLERGDVLLLPRADGSLEGAAATLRVGACADRGPCADARIVGDTVAVVGGLRMTDHALATAAEGGRTAGSLGELELPVQFELETLAIPLADLEGVEPGYVLELATPVAQARLRLVACGAYIGEADLVSIGGRLGARITHLAARHDADQQRG